MEHLKGVGVALVTPFNEDKTIDFDSITRLTEYQIAGGVDFMVVMGTTAEAATLNAEERAAVISHIIKVNANRLPLVIGIGGNDSLSVKKQMECIDLSSFDAILSVSPYYNRPSQEGIYQHYRELASTGKNIILYNVPSRTGQNVEAETTLRLAREFPNIFAVKEAGPNINQYFDLLRKRPENFSVLSGDDEFTLPVTLAGGDGVISVVAQAYPQEFREMISLAREGKVKEAYAIHNRLVEITRMIFAEGNPSGIKKVLAEMGLIQNYLRLPLVPVSETLGKKIADEMKAARPNG